MKTEAPSRAKIASDARIKERVPVPRGCFDDIARASTHTDYYHYRHVYQYLTYSIVSEITDNFWTGSIPEACPGSLTCIKASAPPEVQIHFMHPVAAPPSPSPIRAEERPPVADRGLRTLLPREHGAWGQLIAPAFTALLQSATLSFAGFALTVATATAVLAHEPLLVLLGRRGGQLQNRFRSAASAVLLALGICSVVCTSSALLQIGRAHV